MTPAHSPLPIGGVGLGSTMFAEGFGPIDRDGAIETINRAFDAGIRFFDTAWFYSAGKVESLLGEVLASRRSDVRLCTKGGVSYSEAGNLLSLVRDASYEALRAGIEQSLERLRTDYVDVYLLHQQDVHRAPEQQMENLARLQEEGLTKHVGFCNFGSAATHAALATGIPSFVEFSCSLLDRRYVEDLTAAGAAGCKRITFGTFAHGLLSERWAPDHEFAPTDWRSRSRSEGQSGTSGNVFFAGDAFADNLRVADRLRELASEQGVSLAAFVLALTLEEPVSDIALLGCRTVDELNDALVGLQLVVEEDIRRSAAAVLAVADRPTRNQLGDGAFV